MQPGDRGDAGVRQQLGKAADDLQKVNYAGLSNDLKAQYDTAKRFITLGEQALKEQNLIFAATLADKAGAIATLLLRSLTRTLALRERRFAASYGSFPNKSSCLRASCAS